MKEQSPDNQSGSLRVSLPSWISKFEAGTLLTLLAGAIVYTGEIYYRAYSGFFYLYEVDIDRPFSAHVTKSLVVAIVSILLVVVVNRSGQKKDDRFRGALIGNIPCLVLLLFTTVVLIDIYWLNVKSHSSALVGLQSDSATATQHVLERTLLVESFLRWAVLIVPPIASLAIFIWLSVRRFSFSHSVVCAKAGHRACIVAIYVILALRVVGIWGRTAAFMDFIGVFGKQEVVITLSDGSSLDLDRKLYPLCSGMEWSHR